MSMFRRLASKNVLKGYPLTSRAQFMVNTQRWFKSVHVVAQFQIKSDKVKEFLAAAEPCINITNKEKGCVTYNVHRDCADGNKFAMIEEWESRAELDAHLETDHVKQFINVLQDVCEKDFVISIYGENLVPLKS